MELARILPMPGPVWGPYPMRASGDAAPAWRWPSWHVPAGFARQVAHRSVGYAMAWSALGTEARAQAIQGLRAAHRRDGLRADALAHALGIACACAGEFLALTPRHCQVLAAAALLDNRMAEMATGEGKTLAIALAAAVAALAGIPVHVVTANAYLARRDAATMAPLFQALGVQAAAVAGVAVDAARRAAYAHAIVYATAKDLAFDFLRDRQAATMAGGELEHAAAGLAHRPLSMPLMRGLCMALLDEADSILLDEAEVPLILSRSAPHAARRAFLWQALALARQLAAGLDYTLQPVDRLVHLTPAGEQCLAAMAGPLGGPWTRPRYRREAVLTALAGLHSYQRNLHYVVRDGAIELLDEVSGRVAHGRVWSRGLHTVVALKEGLSPPQETETVVQTTFQRFFQRYWRLCGISGTLWEARAELAQVYGARVVRVPLDLPSRRLICPARRFSDRSTLFRAVAERVAQLQAAGRPVLVGTDSVADTLELSTLLGDRGIAHRVLNALNDDQEALIIADAGRAGQVTVATRMAGRGTDISVDDQALAAGGLHVLSIQHNPSRRLDRQLDGRAARHGDPGSTEAWCRDDHVGLGLQRAPLGLEHWNRLAQSRLMAWIVLTPRRWAQQREDRRRTALRQDLLEQDLHWERRLAFAGAAP